jgi:protein TonB
METKKTQRADLEKERTTFFLMGFAVVLSTFFVLMEWQSPNSDVSGLDFLNSVFIENEFAGHIEAPSNFNSPENQAPVIIEKQEPKVVLEGYNIVDEIVDSEENPEELQTQLQVVSNTILPKIDEKKPAIPINHLETTDSDVHFQADVMPQFPGGQVELIRFIYANIQYPSAALKQRIQGRVWCSFIIHSDGSVSDVRLENGVYIFLDEEAIRVLQKMPDWTPGRINEKEVNIRVYLPIVFKL